LVEALPPTDVPDGAAAGSESYEGGFSPFDSRSGEALETQGAAPCHVPTVGDRVVLTQRRWQAPGLRSRAPLDGSLDAFG
jgi:hypothetical protein